MAYDLLGEAFHQDPAPVLSALRAAEPVHWSAGLGTWVLTRFDDVSEVVRDPTYSVDRGGSIAKGGDPSVAAELAWCSEFVLRWMVFADPPRHTRLRNAVFRAFTRSAIERLRPVTAQATEEALAQAARRGRLEVIADVATPVPARVTAALLGLPLDDVGLLKAWTADMFDLFGAGVASAEVVRRAYRSMQTCRDYFAGVIAERRRRGGDDLLAAIVASEEGAALDDDELIGLAVTLVAGAYETTTHVLGNGIWQLLRHPEQLARLRAEPALIERAVEEIFRYDGPAVSVVRRATRDVTIRDVAIRAGDNLYCMLYAANRDPARYPEPDRFDVTREDVRHLGLGHGIHFCLGAALSRLELAVMLAALVRLDDLALDTEALGAETPTYLPNLAIRGLRALPITFRAHRDFLALST